MKFKLKRLLALTMVSVMVICSALSSSVVAYNGNPIIEADIIAEAVITKIPGNTNILKIIVRDKNLTYAEGEFIINNNSDDIYYVGGYSVFVSTYGNDKINKCYIVSAPKQYNLKNQFSFLKLMKILILTTNICQ
jgi:hypothetical protein